MGCTVKAVCAKCGEECAIPFDPVEGRPVKCNECFRRDIPRGEAKKRRRDVAVVCAECKKETTVPFKPVQGRPVLCRECFRK